MTNKEKIQVMQAFEEGATIEKLCGKVWLTVPHPEWNWMEEMYRVKKESVYRPFKSNAEFFEESKKHGFYMHHKEKSYELNMIPLDIRSDGAYFPDELAYTWNLILKCFTWCDDGSPCGIKED